MKHVIMIIEIIKIGIDQVVEIEEFYLGVEYSVEKIKETDQGPNRIIGMALGDEILEVI